MAQSPIQQWHAQHLTAPLELGPAAVREQIGIAMDSVPTDPAKVDAWFNTNFRKPPISDDAELLGRLQVAKKALKAALHQQP